MKCIRCGAEVENNANSCSSCSLEFTDEMKVQMVAYEKQMAEYNRQMEEYNRQMAEMNQNAQVPPVGGQPNVNPRMGMAGYAYGNGNMQTQAQPIKKKYVPNILTILGVMMAVAAVFLPYAKQGNTTRSIWDVFGNGSTTDLLLVAGGMGIALIAFICCFFRNTACKVINLICSLCVAGALIFEFVLTMLDKQDYANAALGYGSIISIVAAGILMIAVPIWSLIFRKK